MDGEGDAWFDRNLKTAHVRIKLLARRIAETGLKPTRILEIGCAGGGPLDFLRETFNADCHGIDPSEKAISHARATHPEIGFSVGTADELPYADASFDLVVLGFCLYIIDPQHHFRVAWQIDRVLMDKGAVAIIDFLPPSPYRNPYAHRPGIYAHKMQWADMLAWHPSYTLLSRTYQEHGEPFGHESDERVAIDILYKDAQAAFPDRPNSTFA